MAVKITIRLDDITPGMDWTKFDRFKSLLDQYDIKPLIGVVPDNADPHLNISDVGNKTPEDKISGDKIAGDNILGDKTLEGENFWDYVKELQKDGWTIAMHGMNHVYTTNKGGMFPLNDFSEFAGLPYEEQEELLNYGRDIFNQHGLETDIFMAPGHSYDRNTLKALKNQGFNKITDGFGDQPYTYGGICFYPISFKRSRTLKASGTFSTFVYHANEMNEKDFENLDKLLANQGNEYEIVSFSEYLKADAVAKGELGHLKEYIMAKGKHLIGKLR